jgi:hypothetical protein
MTAVFGITQPDWFARQQRLSSDVAHFWLPTPRRPRRVEIGERWYLREGNGYGLLGYGTFAGYEALTPRQLFAKYGAATGYDTLEELVAGMTLASRQGVREYTTVGNAVLTELRLLPEPVPLPFNMRAYSGSFIYPSKDQVEDLAIRFPASRRTDVIELPPGTPPEKKERMREEFLRDRRHVLQLKELYKGRCQVSGEMPLAGTAGDITEGHHIEWLTRGGVDGPDNIVIVSPDWHRALHATDAHFDWAKLCFVIDRRKVPLKLNKHLKSR